MAVLIEEIIISRGGHVQVKWAEMTSGPWRPQHTGIWDSWWFVDGKVEGPAAAEVGKAFTSLQDELNRRISVIHNPDEVQ